jgi:hypothetical protein
VVEVPPPPATVSWRKSSASSDSGCVEVARTHEYVWVRDSNRPGGPIVGFTRQDWAVFLIGVRRGEFDNLPV